VFSAVDALIHAGCEEAFDALLPFREHPNRLIRKRVVAAFEARVAASANQANQTTNV
jgi:hypothetical protein